MAREQTDLPFGDAFGPAQIKTKEDEPPELAIVLEFAKRYESNSEKFDHSIADKFFPNSPDPLNRAKNVRLGIGPVGYQIVGENFEFTDLGTQLYDLRNDSEAMYDRFARHILLNLHGLKGIEIVEDLEAEGRRTVNANIKQEFRDQYDFHIDETSNHWSQMRAWMAKAGIVNTRSHVYDIDRSKIEELIGVSQDDLLGLDGLTTEQQAFLRALALINPNTQIRGSVVKQIAEEAYDVRISQSNISKKTLDPLESLGYISWEHRDGKSNRIETTDKFESDVLKPLLAGLAQRTGVPRRVLRQSFDEILAKMDAESTHEKGVALETLAIKLGRLLGLNFVGWRVRGEATGGSEVDVVMDDVGKAFARWQIQCKNTKNALQTKHVAREVGITRTLQTNVLLMIARGGVSSDARQFATQVMQHENIAIVFLAEDDLDQLDSRVDHLLDTLKGQSRRIQRIKRLNKEGRTGSDQNRSEEDVLDSYEDKLSDYQPESDDSSLTEFIDGDES
jgi:hypothetical protein